MDRLIPCNQCGFETPKDDFSEGVCVDCCEANQKALDVHNWFYDEWEKLSDKDRETRINMAIT